jgi:aromatic-L-amino-acid decarboxylase
VSKDATVLGEENLDPRDWTSMRALGHRMVDDALDYVQTLRDRPVWKHAPEAVKQRFVGPPPVEPEPPEAIYEEYLQYIRPHQLGNNHPRFWGWVVGTGTVMGMFAELLASATNGVSGAFAYMSSNYVEMQVIDWTKELMGFPPEAGGQLTSGCSAANLIGLAVARNSLAGFDLRTKGVQGAPKAMTVYCSEEGHSSLQKAVELLGLGSEFLRRIAVNTSMQIDLGELKAAIRRDRESGLHPLCVVGICGTTNAGAIDDLPALADICGENGMWFHVDGAFGGWASIAPNSKRLVAGLERADSVALDFHKWMYLPYPLGCVLVRNSDDLYHAFALSASYLAHGEGERGLTGVDVPWISDFGYELSRGFEALKAWMTIKEHGTAKYGRVIQQNIDQAHFLGGLVEAAQELELALPVSLNVVCFRYRRNGLGDSALDALNKSIEVELQERGIAVPSIVTIMGRKYLHVAITNHRSRREDFELLVREVIRIGDELA